MGQIFRSQAFWGATVVALIAALTAAIYFFVIDGAIPKKSRYDLDIDVLRALAAAPDDALPVDVRVETLARTPAPYFALRAGGGLRQAIMARSTFQIRTPTDHYVLEAGMDQDLAEEYGQAADFDAAVWDRIQDLMASSRGVLVTHEHPDHIGGVVRHRNPDALADKVILTQAQLDGLPAFAPDEGAMAPFADYEPISLDGPRRIAPGIVMLPAAGHTPGSVIIFVRLASGDEFLFIGDIAYTRSNVIDGVDRARFVRFLMVDPEDRGAVVNQLSALHALSETHPEIHIVPAHAEPHLRDLIKAGVVHEGFAMPEPGN